MPKIILLVFPLFFLLAGFQTPHSWAKGAKNYQQLLEEVFQTETVYPQEEGEVQLQLSPNYEEDD